MRWAYGVTTCASRLQTTLPTTLCSLAEAGFDKPHIFVDGVKSFELDGHQVTTRYPAVRTHGHWTLSMLELNIRNPTADRFALFQDDILMCRGTREYLDKCQPVPGLWYLNLYTYPENHALAENNKHSGWFRSSQRGRGAQALVFDRNGCIQVIASRKMALRPQNLQRGWCNVDGGIGDAMKADNYVEWCHFPSLVQHVGNESSMGHRNRHVAFSFPGEVFDARTLLK